MEHQYPSAISGDEHMLAELMLPDQTHVRSQDWTMFFLHRDSGSEDENEYGDGSEGQAERLGMGNQDVTQEGDGQADAEEDSEGEHDEEEDFDGPPLMYVLNLVNTKQDNSVKRYVFPIH